MFLKENVKLAFLIANLLLLPIVFDPFACYPARPQIGTNHLGHFLLTSLLLPSLRANARVVNHASSAYAFAVADFVAADWMSEKRCAWIVFALLGSVIQSVLRLP